MLYIQKICNPETYVILSWNLLEGIVLKPSKIYKNIFFNHRFSGFKVSEFQETSKTLESWISTDVFLMYNFS